MRKNFNILMVMITVFAITGQQNSFAASKAKIDAEYKKIYRKMVNMGNNDAIAAMSYYDVEIKRAIGKVLDGKVKCDSSSKSVYKSKAFDAYESEVNQLINGFYLGYCNAK